jgi:murein DD-endopeptidase MepM/ murein hydrolase activator NlpD
MERVRGFALLGVLLLVSAASDDLLRAVREMPSLPPVVRAPVEAKAPAPTASTQLLRRKLAVPVQGVRRSQLRDTFTAARSRGRSHKAIDIMAPWGTPVLASDEGKVAKISSNRGGGLAVYLVDDTGRFVYYYAHLAGYAEGLREGQAVQRGDVIGYVGTTGNAPKTAPHLHFAVLLLTGEHRWWGGEAVNPYPALAQGG